MFIADKTTKNLSYAQYFLVKNSHLAKISNKAIVWHITTTIKLPPQDISMPNMN